VVIDKNTGETGTYHLLSRFVSGLQVNRRLPLDRDSSIPRISVVMPSYNQAQYIERSILSVLNQNYPNLDFVIIDGGATDGTVDVIRKYSKHLSYWISELDYGQSDALNKGFARATGHIFGWLNSDDLYTPEAFKRATAALAEFPAKSVVHGDWLSIDSGDRPIAYEYSFDFNLNQFKYEGFHLNAQAMFWRREVHERFGGFDPGLHMIMDYQMILAFGINEGEAAFLRVPMALGCFRRHADQKTQDFSDAYDAYSGEHRLIALRYCFEDKYGPIGSAKRFLYRFRRGYYYIKRGGVPYLWGKLMGILQRVFRKFGGASW
jgi:glycosyltransferase involved in cell wall biosynthesis